MEQWWRALKSRMAGRLLRVLLVVAALPLATAVLLASRDAARRGVEHAEARLALLGDSYAAGLGARLEAAASLAQALAAADAGPDGALLRERVLDSRAFRSIAVFDPEDHAGPAALVRAPTEAQRAAAASGRTVLLSAALGERRRSVYLLRAVRAGERPAFAFFELVSDWLWERGAARPQSSRRVAVVDADGGLVHADAPLADELVTMFAQRAAAVAERRESRAALAWQAAGGEWQGSLGLVPLDADQRTVAPWAVVVFEPKASYLELAAPGREGLGPALLIALLAVALALVHLASAYVPGLRALRRALLLAREEQATQVPVASAADEVRDALEAFNLAAAAVRDRLRALTTLGEIDRLLLSASELEQMLDAILSRVRSVTRCHSVGITLLDADAPAHGRVYVAWDGLAELPVSRVTLDADMLAVLAEAPGGLTIARCEEERHSFLTPLKERGAEVFWVWPVTAGERFVAILAVGYRDTLPFDAETARYGAEFAGRLAIALSNSARDEQLYRQAHFDPLTQLPNRLLFRDRLAQELASASGGLSRGALLYIDLDHFKQVNDSVGHSAGDQLLQIVAQRLRSCIKEGDTVARLGGDEFTVILRNVADLDAARAVGERIIDSLRLPVNIVGRDHFVRASIGITLFPDDAASIEDLMRNADVAMYRAKASGRGRLTFFDRAMTGGRAGVADSGLFRALRRREFALFYQPQFMLEGGHVAALEALLRWQSPRDGLRHPGEFVPAAEESGLITDIGGWVLETACAQLATWRDQGIAPPRLALNVSVQQLKHAEFPRSVRRVLERFGLPPQLLELEVTESVFGEGPAVEALARLAEMGVRLALDDFGTGYSSLNYLRQYPVQVLKIDRSFIEEVPHNPAAATLAETIVVMAHALRKLVVAEGVETLEQLEFLRERRCDIAQGFYLARPLSVAAATELLQARPAPESLDLRETG